MSQPLIREATRTLIHRGPDDEGFHFEGSLGLGFRRLSIIDLAGGHQPMSTPDENYWLVFNGEIFNYRELREELRGLGHLFRTSSDTEVILHAYGEWDLEFLNRLNGMFALALWDRRTQKFLLARDRYGIKGVYYTIDHDGIAFASEMRALSCGLDASPSIDETSMKLFLKYRYIPAPRSPYSSIRKLAAGTYLLVDANGESTRRWYRRKGGRKIEARSRHEVVEELEELYRQAVRRHLISDVPVGLFLSGGIDSSLLLALMNQAGANWRTYSVGFGRSFKDDELDYATRTAAHFGSTHENVLLDQAEFEESLPRVVSYLEEPVAAASIVPMFFVSQRAREDVKVALIGQGPDEVWGGYARHLGLRYAHLWRKIPTPLQALIGRGLTAVSSSEAVRRALNSLNEPDRLSRYDKVFSLTTEEAISSLFQSGEAEVDSSELMISMWASVLEDVEDADELTAFQVLETSYSLPDELLMYADKLSMAHSLEVRVPYLDPAIVEFASTIPQHLKVRNLSRKYVHREIASHFLPPEIIRRKKRGFAGNVVDDWFRGSMERKFYSYIADPKSKIYDFLDYSNTNALLQQHRNRQSDYHKLLFSIVLLEEWLRLPRSGYDNQRNGDPTAAHSN